MPQLRATRLTAVAHPRPPSMVASALDALTPSLALSLRRLRSYYTGPLIRVRRSSDNTTMDVGFTAAGNLDTAALLAFVGTGSAFVTTWYDQSGSGCHAVQSTMVHQPAIVESGVLIAMNGVPSMRFSGNQWLRSPVAMNGTAGTLSIVRRIDGAAAAWCGLLSLGHSGSGADNDSIGKMVHGRSSTSTNLDTRQRNVFFTSTSAAYGVSYIDLVRYSGTRTECRVNGVLAGSNNSMPISLASTFTLIGGRDNGSSAVGGFLTGMVSEAVLFGSALPDGAAQALERSQGSYYNITVS